MALVKQIQNYCRFREISQRKLGNYTHCCPFSLDQTFRGPLQKQGWAFLWQEKISLLKINIKSWFSECTRDKELSFKNPSLPFNQPCALKQPALRNALESPSGSSRECSSPELASPQSCSMNTVLPHAVASGVSLFLLLKGPNCIKPKENLVLHARWFHL